MEQLVKLLYQKGFLSESELSGLNYQAQDDKYMWAREIVNKMHHSYNGTEYRGEKYPMSEINEVYNMYKHQLDPHVKPYHVYIALNAQYHDYCPIFKRWGLDDIDYKIKDSAMTFWFMDEDYEGCKVDNYFHAK